MSYYNVSPNRIIVVPCREFEGAFCFHQPCIIKGVEDKKDVGYVIDPGKELTVTLDQGLMSRLIKRRTLKWRSNDEQELQPEQREE